MNKKLVTVALLGTMLTSSLVLPTVAHAESYDSKIEEARNKAENNQLLMDQKNQELNNLNKKATSTKQELQSISGAIDSNEAKTKKLVEEMQATKKERENLLKDISSLEKNIEKRNEQLKEQARVVQVSGETENYIDFVIEAESVGDIIGRIGVVSDLVGANKNLVQKQVEDKKAVVAKKEKTEQTIVQQDTMAGELEMLRSDMEKQSLEKEVLVAQLALESSSAQKDIEKYSAMKEKAESEVAQYTSAQKEAEVQAELVAAQQEQEQEQEATEEPVILSENTNEESVAGADSQASSENSPERLQPVKSASAAASSNTNSDNSNNSSSNSSSSNSSNSNNSSSNSSNSNNSSSNSSSSNNSSSNSSSSNSSSSNSSSSHTITTATTTSSSSQSSKKTAAVKKEEPKASISSGSVLSVAGQIVSQNSGGQIPYVWGGTTMSGFDCSGFTQYVFAKAGKSIPRDSRAQYTSATKVSNPQPGDLVFFGKSSSPSSIFHVAFYTGGGNMVGSQSSTGPAYKNNFKSNAYWGNFHVFYGRY